MPDERDADEHPGHADVPARQRSLPGSRRGGRRWHAACFRGNAEVFQMYSILYIIGAIVVIVVVLRVLGLL